MALTINFEPPPSGRIGKGTIIAENGDGHPFFDKADLTALSERKRLTKSLADRFGESEADIGKKLEELAAQVFEHQKQQQQQQDPARQDPARNGAAANELTTNILDSAPPVIRRPLCVIEGRGYAAAWLPLRTEVHQRLDPETGEVQHFDPPKVEDSIALAILREDGQLFFGDALPGARPLAELGIDLRLPSPIPPDRAWSGAGVKRFLAGERPDPVEVFSRVKAVMNTFMDFNRSLASQDTVCEMVACYVMATYFLDSFDVVGYLWPNGDRGAGKTNFLVVVAELAYLGMVILAGGSYASLRDLADYGATLAFDDAEAVMDVRRTDPDKRALLLAGNRRGATITVKEPAGERGWVIRYVDAFCPRLFSAIRLPDDVLGSRSIVVPLVRSGDEERAKRSPLDPEAWPCQRRQLIDDLWALAVSRLADLRTCDREAARQTQLTGRNLEPWRGILAIALWLECYGAEGLSKRMEDLAMTYQTERRDFESANAVVVAIRALREIVEKSADASGNVEFHTRRLVELMNSIAREEDLTEGDKDFTNARRVGWLVKRLRFRKSDQRGIRGWKTSRAEVEALARSYGLLEPPKYWMDLHGEPVEATADDVQARIRNGEKPSDIFLINYDQSGDWDTAEAFGFHS